jgi:hypothetical protein
MTRFAGFLGRPSVTSRPPTHQEMRRNDWLLFLCVVALMAAGWLIVRVASAPDRKQALGEGLSEVTYPAGWLLASAEGERLFGVTNAASPSLFASTMEIAALPALPGSTLGEARTSLSLQRSRELERYRELASEAVTVLGAPALLVRYAWVADPTKDSGGNGLPVVVEAQDLILARGEGWARATVAADASEYEQEESAFARFYASLGLERSAQ